ncbi:MAG: stage II sporulation protein M [Chloroflexota bacterium]|nr:stage II sporulation protein M [Chloroflexota bacterium]
MAERALGIRQRLPGYGQRVAAELRPALVLTRREVKDTLRDWRIVAPVLLLITIFPFLANIAAGKGLAFVNQYGADLIMQRLFPFLMLVVGFFPSTFSLVIALETFVGEKERRSLEPLLATPLSDRQLYIGKLLASTIPPVIASYIGMIFYVLLLGFTVQWWPTLSLFIVGLVLATAQSLVMVSAAVIASTQSTSVRAANLMASFIIVPMAFLLQGEAGLLLFGDYALLWLVALGLIVLDVLLIRMGIATFNREHVLGREIDSIDFEGGVRTFWEALRPQGGVKDLYSREVPRLVRAMRTDLLFTVLVTLGGGALIGWWGAGHFPLPVQAIDFSAFKDMASIQTAVQTTGLLSDFSVGAIFWNNVRALLAAAFFALFSLGTLAELLLVAPMAIIAYVFVEIQRVGINPWMFLFLLVLPHGILELPAALLATAQAMHTAVMLLRSPEKGGGMLGIMRELGHFVKLFVAVALPLLLLAAWVEATITPRLAINFLSGL